MWILVLTHKRLKNTEIKPAEVHRKLASLKVDKSPGPDGMHPRVLQEMANTLDTPLAMPFNKSIKDGIVPMSHQFSTRKPS